MAVYDALMNLVDRLIAEKEKTSCYNSKCNNFNKKNKRKNQAIKFLHKKIE